MQQATPSHGLVAPPPRVDCYAATQRRCLYALLAVVALLLCELSRSWAVERQLVSELVLYQSQLADVLTHNVHRFAASERARRNADW